MRIEKLYFFIAISISILMYIYFNYYMFIDERVCFVDFSVVCMSSGNVSGLVYGPCEYSGVVEVPPPVSAGDFRCVAAGRVGNETAVVFVGTVFTGLPDPKAPFDTGLKRLCGMKKGFKAFPDIGIGYPAILVVYPERGVGYLSFIYNGLCRLSSLYDKSGNTSSYDTAVDKPIAKLNHSAFLFALDGVYLKSEYRDAWGYADVPLEVGVKTEILGPTLNNCVFVIKTAIDISKLRIGPPLHNASGRYIKTG